LSASHDPYDIVDPILMPWAAKHRVRVGKIFRDDPVRSIWVYDRLGNQRAQIWLEIPKADGETTVVVAEFLLSSPSKWRRRVQETAALKKLEEALEHVRILASEWGAPGRLPSNRVKGY
jgi:hypothetical protein